MASSIIDLVIKARDGASSILARVNAALLGTRAAGDGAAGGMENLSNAFAVGAIKAQLFGVALGKVQQGIGFVQNKLMEATSIQTENIQNIGTLSALTGISYDQAGDFVDKLNTKIAEMGKTLPVAAQDIKSVAGAIQDDLIEAFKTANGVNFKGLETALVGISSDFAVLGKSANVASGDVQMGLARFLGGASSSEYEQLNLFQRNNALKNELKRQLKGRENKNLTVQERVQILQSVGSKLNSPETRKRLAGSVQGLISNFQDTLFDPDTGIFGFMKDVDPKLKGRQSVLTAFNAALEELIGDNGLFNNIGKLLAAAGIQLADPMALLKSGIDTFTAGLQKVNEALGAAREFYNMGSNLPQVLKSLTSYFGITKNIFNPDRYRNIGSSLGSLVGSIGVRVLDFLQSINWNAVFDSVGQVFNAAIATMQGFLSNLSTSLLPRLLGATQSIDSGAISTAVSLGIEKLFGAIATLFRSIDWGIVAEIGLTLLDKVMQTNLPLIISGLVIVGTALFVGLGAIIAAIGATGISAVLAIAAFSLGYWFGTVLYNWWTQDVWPTVQEWWNGTSTFCVKAWNDLWSAVGNFFKSLFNSVNNWWMGLTNGVTSWWTNLGSNLNKTWTGIWLGVTQSLTDTVDAIASWWQNLVQGIKDKVGQILTNPLGETTDNASVGMELGPLRTGTPPAASGPRYMGQIPHAAGGWLGGLMSAATAESRAMPSGASLVVANTSEWILTPDQARRLMQSSAAVGAANRGGNTINFAPTFNIQGVDNPRSIALMALEELNSMVQDYIGGQLA